MNRDCDGQRALADGHELLPSLAGYFFAPSKPVVAWLRELHAEHGETAATSSRR